jgi:prophage tail gpP-like protein
MEIRIAGHSIKLYNQVAINLKYDSIADTFNFRLYFDPSNPTHKKIFQPGTYRKCTIVHRGVLVMTGTVLCHRFFSAGDPPKQLIEISGYSVTGVLADCCVVNTVFTEGQPQYQFDNKSSVDINQGSLQFANVDLATITKTVTAWYGLGAPVIEPELLNETAFNVPYKQSLATGKKDTDYRDITVAEFLDMLCKQKNVVLSHTADGRVLLTRVKASKMLTTPSTTVLANTNPTPFTNDVAGAPVATVNKTTGNSAARAILHDFKENDPKVISMSLSFNGQRQHRIIQVVGEENDSNPANKTIANPMVAAGTTRYIRMNQTSGNDNDTPLTARAAIGDELKNIVLEIEIQGWALGGNLVTPNQMITATNPELFLYSRSKWFIQEVALLGDEKSETAILTCVPPESFNSDPIKNIFA